MSELRKDPIVGRWVIIAHERARRFQSAPLTLPFAAARRHVEARAEDLAQTRPECGHATNAICFVGRRERTRGARGALRVGIA